MKIQSSKNDEKRLKTRINSQTSKKYANTIKPSATEQPGRPRSITIADLSEEEKSKVTRLVDKLVSLGKEHEETIATLSRERSRHAAEIDAANRALKELSLKESIIGEIFVMLPNYLYNLFAQFCYVILYRLHCINIYIYSSKRR